MYLHNWSIGDLVIYDNWSTIHYRDAFIGKRKLKRVTWDQDWCKYIGNKNIVSKLLKNHLTDDK